MFNSFFDNESNILDEDEDENMRWSNENDSNDPETLECDITEAEEYEAIRILKNGKAPGPNWLIGEFFKNSATYVVPFLVRYINKLFSSGLYPEDWSEAITQPLFKKGDLDIPDNYRGISLLSICSKLYSYILNKRLPCWIENNNLLNESQAGFRSKYSTIDHLFILMSLIQK